MIESIKTKWQISHPKYKVCHLVFINSILIVSQTRHRRFSVSKSVYNKISNVRKKGCPKLRANYANKNKTDVLYPQRKLPCCWLSCSSSSFVTHQRSHWIACIKTWKVCLKQKKKRKNIRKKMRDDSAVVILFRFLNVSWKCFDQLLSC